MYFLVIPLKKKDYYQILKLRPLGNHAVYIAKMQLRAGGHFIFLAQCGWPFSNY